MQFSQGVHARSMTSRLLWLTAILVGIVVLAACQPIQTPAITYEPASTVEPTETVPANAEQESVAARLAEFVIVPEETTAGYSIQEVFLNNNNALVTAVGVTSEVEGGLTLNYDDPSASEFSQFVVGISTLESERPRRDRAIRSKWLESATYPLATFDVTEVRNFPANPEEGEPITFQLAGDMKVKETTREVVWNVAATLEGDRLTGTATLDTFLTDFNIPIPSIADILRVTDGITLKLEFVMERVGG